MAGGMACAECGGARFEFVGLAGDAAHLRCTRCGRVLVQPLDAPAAAPSRAQSLTAVPSAAGASPR